MTIRHQIEVETIFFVFVAAFLGAFFAWNSNKSFREQFRVSIPITDENKTQNVISPTVNPIIKVDTASQLSPDGTKKLVMKATHNNDGTVNYIFTTADQSGENQTLIYTVKLEGSENMNIPFNAWSPDNKYLFIIKNGNEALVFKATGEPVASDQAYYDVKDLYNKGERKDIFSETTGWASETLLIVNTVNQDGNKGSSYWFEVPSKAIIQLSTQF
ncbi:MAG: hypothetical protein HYT83_01260 [Candidatus Levybacteria bacterium]|nr:hypothetical protein [Candidatus Levybacteria bacterium]